MNYLFRLKWKNHRRYCHNATTEKYRLNQVLQDFTVAVEDAFGSYDDRKDTTPLGLVFAPPFFGENCKKFLENVVLSFSYKDVIWDWYDEYRFRDSDMCYPWEVINYCDELWTESSVSQKTTGLTSVVMI